MNFDLFFSDEIVRFYYCKTNDTNYTKVIIEYFSHVNLHLINKIEYVLRLRVNKLSKIERRKVRLKILYSKITLRNGTFWKIQEYYEW